MVGSVLPVCQCQWNRTGGLWTPPPNHALLALIAPSNSILGLASGSSRNCRLMHRCRTRLAMDVQTCLANTIAILAQYLRHLSCWLGAELSNSSLATEIRVASSYLVLLSKEQANATGGAIARF